MRESWRDQHQPRQVLTGNARADFDFARPVVGACDGNGQVPVVVRPLRLAAELSQRVDHVAIRSHAKRCAAIEMRRVPAQRRDRQQETQGHAAQIDIDVYFPGGKRFRRIDDKARAAAGLDAGPQP